jgi:hypothetical protein
VTGAEFDRACHYCHKVWSTEKRGALWDYEEFQSRVLLSMVEKPTKTIALHCLHTLRDMQREEKREAEVKALLSFEAQRHAVGDVLPATFVVPHETRGGVRANSGGRRPGAGRKPRAA